MIMNVTPITMFLIQPVYGFMSDRLGHRKCLLASTLLAGILFLLYLKEGSFLGLLLVTVCMSLFYNGIQPILDALALKLAEQSPDFNYGSIRVAGAAGWAFTGIITGYYIDELDTRVIFMFASGSLIAAFLVALTLPDTPALKPGETCAPLRRSIRDLMSRNLVFFLISVVLLSASVTTIWNFYSLYMKENGASATLVGAGLSLQGLFELPFFFFSFRVIRYFGLERTLLICAGASALRMALYSMVSIPEWALAVDLLHGLSWSLFWVVCVEYTNTMVKPELRVTGQSLLYASYFGVGAVLGNFWTGYLYDLNLRISTIFFINSMIVVALCMFIAAFVNLVSEAGSS